MENILKTEGFTTDGQIDKPCQVKITTKTTCYYVSLKSSNIFFICPHKPCAPLGTTKLEMAVFGLQVVAEPFNNGGL